MDVIEFRVALSRIRQLQAGEMMDMAYAINAAFNTDVWDDMVDIASGKEDNELDRDALELLRRSMK